jgi:peptide/nickel transport system ATP-binding protein
MAEAETLLSVRNLTTKFDTGDGVLRAVDDVSFDIKRGETLCIVGESGSGKTVASESLSRIIKTPPGRIDGELMFDGRDITELSESELRDIRGGRIAHIFQNPQDALNHCYTVGWQIVEAIQTHRDVSDAEAREQGIEMLDRVGIPEAAARFDDYPHEFSGGMKQRVMIAMALVTEPDLLIADEPTTALDVTIQAQILRLLNEIQEEFGTSILFITHDLGVVAEMADRVVVMYAGKIMETGDVYTIFENPAHPYTQALMDCLPGRGDSTKGIEGSLPDPTNPPDGCRFADRCPHAIVECESGEQPPLYPVAGDQEHNASCIYFGDGYDSSTVRGSSSAASTSVSYEEGMNDD